MRHKQVHFLILKHSSTSIESQAAKLSIIIVDSRSNRQRLKL